MAGAEDSDLETRQLHLEANEVLIPKEDAREVEASRLVTRRSLLLALCLGLVLLVPVRKNVQAVVSQLLQLDEEPPEDMPCFVQGVYYHHPAMMAGELETYQPSPEACQVECKKEPRCLHFTYWPDGGCLLTTSVSTLKASGLGYSDALSGPKDCDDLVHFQREFHTGTVFCDEHPIWEGATASHAVCRRRCNNNENCAWYSYWHSGGEHWCRLTQHCQTMSEQPEHSISVYQKVTPELPEARPKLLNKQIRNQTAGVNGTKCKSYPACEALNVTKGTCCPNNNGIFLSCCSATVEKAKEALKAALNHTADPTPQPGMLRILPPPPPAVPAVPPV